jgi:hypothetical protein
MYNSSPVWRFSDNGVEKRSSADLSNFAGTFLVRPDRARSLTQSEFARTIGQFFLVALSEELKVRQLCPNRIAIRSTIDRKDSFSPGAGMHIELDVAVEGKNAIQNQFIDAVLAARRTCLASPVPEVKLRLTAQLERDT